MHNTQHFMGTEVLRIPLPTREEMQEVMRGNKQPKKQKIKKMVVYEVKQENRKKPE